MKHAKIAAALFFFFSISSISCRKEDTGTNTDTANIMLIQASPDAPALDAFTDTVKLNSTPLSYPAPTGYLYIAAGNQSISFKQSGTGTIFFNTAIYPFIRYKSYSFFIVDSAAKASVIGLQDNLSLPAAGKTNFRMLHLSPNTANVDFILRSGPDSIAITNKAFKDVTDLYAIDGKSYDIRVKLAGTQTVIASATGVALNSRKIYTIFLKGFTGGTGSTALGLVFILNNY